MPSAAKAFIALGAALCAMGVVLGAFGAHALKAQLGEDLLAVWHTAVQYHLWHALGLILIGFALIRLPSSSGLRVAGWLLTAGIALFSGSLYALALSGERWLGAITPLGGASFIFGWLLFAWAILRA